MDQPKPSLTTPIAVIIGSIIIGIAILASNGTLPFKNNIQGAKTAVSITPQPSMSQVDNQADLEKRVIQSLKTIATKLNLDQAKFDQCLDSGEKAAVVKEDFNDGNNLAVGGTPAYFINGHKSGGAFPYDLFKSIVDFELAGGDWNNPPESLKILVDGNENNGEVGKTALTVDPGTLPVLGNKNAPVTIVEFSDYQCPFCSKFYQQTEVPFKKDYVDTGKVKIYFRDYPLSFHAGAQKAAEATRCAFDQGKFWEMHNLIFDNQTDIFK